MELQLEELETAATEAEKAAAQTQTVKSFQGKASIAQARFPSICRASAW